MRYLKCAALCGVLLLAAASTYAQVRVGVAIGAGPVAAGVGAAPVCAYGYYGYYPYACAPYGYYGPQYFVNGVFIGAGPWYRAARYYGHPYYAPRYYRHPVYTAHPYHRRSVVRGHVHEGYRGDFDRHR